MLAGVLLDVVRVICGSALHRGRPVGVTSANNLHAQLVAASGLVGVTAEGVSVIVVVSCAECMFAAGS